MHIWRYLVAGLLSGTVASSFRTKRFEIHDLEPWQERPVAVIQAKILADPHKGNGNGWIAKLTVVASLELPEIEICESSQRVPMSDDREAGAEHDLASSRARDEAHELGAHEIEVVHAENARVQHGLGIVLLQKGKPDEAEMHLRRALEIRPEYHDARFNLSTLQLNQGRYEESIVHSQLLYDDPTYAAVVAELKDEMHRLQAECGDEPVDEVG